MKDNIVCLVFARGGSKGIPNKNVRKLAGKPLIAYSIEMAKECELIDEIFVSTDSEKIAEVAHNYGAQIPFMRPEELATDDSPEWLSWKHALQKFRQSRTLPTIDTLVSLPATSPLREITDVENAIDLYFASNSDLVLTVTPSKQNPYLNMVTLDEENKAELVVNTEERFFRRQDAPPVFTVTTVAYVAKPEFVLNSKHKYEGKIKASVVPTERALDIDTEYDFKIAECLFKNNLQEK